MKNHINFENLIFFPNKISKLKVYNIYKNTFFTSFLLKIRKQKTSLKTRLSQTYPKSIGVVHILKLCHMFHPINK